MRPIAQVTFAFAVGLFGAFPAAADDNESVRATVLLVGEIPGHGAALAAREGGGALWLEEHIELTRTPRPSRPDEALEDLRNLWAEAEFSRCLARSQAPALDPNTLIRWGHLAAAATAIVYSAACALGAGDAQLASSLLRRAVSAELPIVPLLQDVTIDLQNLAEGVVSSVRGTEKVSLEIVSRPPGADIEVNGRPCPSTPCVVDVVPGEHLVVASRLGYTARVQPVRVDQATERILALDPSPAAEQRQQLADAYASGESPGSARSLRTAAAALGSPVVLVVFRARDGYRLALFDRREGSGGRVIARGRSDTNDPALGLATRSLVNEWRDLEPNSVFVSPWFWLSAALVVGIAVVLSVVLSQEPEPMFTLVGR